MGCGPCLRTREGNDRLTVVLKDPGHLRRALGEVTILRRISTREDNIAESTTKKEISGKKDVTTTLNALHQTNWPHLWGNDT